MHPPLRTNLSSQITYVAYGDRVYTYNNPKYRLLPSA